MVKVIKDNFDHSGFGGGAPETHIHGIERHKFGNGVYIKVFGELKIAAKEVVFAKELGLNTLQVLDLTPEHGEHFPIVANKYIHHKGEYDNYASIELFTFASSNQMKAGANEDADAGGTGPSDGSVWLDFVGLGE